MYHNALSQGNIALTPRVALRKLTEQIQQFEYLYASHPAASRLDDFFQYPIPAPIENLAGSVVHCKEVLVSFAEARLTSQGIRQSKDPLVVRRALTEQRVQVHGLAMAIKDLYENACLDQRLNAARATLATGAYWVSIDKLLTGKDGHPLIGLRPHDAIEAHLYDFALDALSAPHQLIGVEETVIDLRIDDRTVISDHNAA